MRASVIYRFGEFELHPNRALLLRAGERVPLGDVSLAILVYLIKHAPHVVSREAIARAGWGGAASQSSVEKAISVIRQTLGDSRDSIYIETVPNRGYRFTATVDAIETRHTSVADSLGAEPLRSLLDGRRALATLSRRGTSDARRHFERTRDAAPDCVPALVGLATACALAFDATRFDAVCDLNALTQAVAHARQATRLEPASADALSALGLALYLDGETDAAAMAARNAVMIEPGSWRHWLRLAYVSWGEDRMEAAHMALTLCPHLALAHWLKATVLIARGAFDAALAELRAGCAAQDQQPIDAASYPAVGLHLLRGLVLAALGRLEDAAAAFEAEISAPDRGQLYWQECAANTWYALGAIRLRRRDFTAADTAFHRALDIAPAHVFSLAALGRTIPAMGANDPRGTDAAIAKAIALARGNRHADAAQIYIDTVAAARAANAGWILPVEPVLHVAERPDVWSAVLTMVRQRAT
jgi:DNA-binding winged helix-turn-helix (wHTH) protein